MWKFLFLIYLLTDLMNFKMVFNQKIGSLILYNFNVPQIYIIYGGIILKNTFEQLFPDIFHIFWLWLYFHLQFVKEWYILSLRCQEQCCAARDDLSFDIHNAGGQRVSSTSPSAIQVKGVSKNLLRIRTQRPLLPPERSR